MSVWEKYENRIRASGLNRREATLKREINFLNQKLPNSLSYHTVVINDLEQNVAIINTDILTEKFIYSLPGESLSCGALVSWENNFWIITEKDVNDEVYTKAKMEQCNYLLKWVDSNAVIHEQWCIIEDGTKYLTGEMEDRHFVITRGDSRIAMRISKNEHTVKLNRENRFLIDDPDSDVKLAYALTKPLKVGHVYNKEGIYTFVLQEVNSTDDDNHELSIADYYKYFPKDNEIVDDSIDEEIDNEFVIKPITNHVVENTEEFVDESANENVGWI